MSKVVLVSGSTSGIGQATCLKLLSEGFRVFAIGRDEDKFNQIFESYNPDLIQFIKFDLNEIEKIEGIFEKIASFNVKLDGLVHCAGIEETIPLSIYYPEKIQKIFQINVFSGIELLRLFSKKKYSNDDSSVVLISSVMGVLGQYSKVGYCGTKASILGITKSSALELSKRRIRVNAVLPGVVETPMTNKLFAQLNEEGIKKIKDMHPLGIGTVDDVTPIILFLISNNSRWITGQEFIVDGGYSIL